MSTNWDEDRTQRLRMAAAAGVCFLALAWIGIGSAGLWHARASGTKLPSLADGVVSGLFVGGAIYAAVVTWRQQSAPAPWRIAPPGALVAAQAVLVTLIALGSGVPRDTTALVALLATALITMIAAIVPVLGLRTDDETADEGCAVGLGMGLMAAGHLLLVFPVATPPVPLVQLVLAVVVATHVTVTALVLHRLTLSRSVSWLLVATVPAVVLEVCLHSVGTAGGWWMVVGSVGRAAVGAGWLAVGWTTVRRALEQERLRVNSVRQVLAANTRDQRERMHELRSTLAGLVTGSALLDSPELPAETRRRLLCSVRRELDRMDRLLSGQSGAPTDIDLDDALGPILDLQRLKGRRVELRSSGDVVHARLDALAEVLNILMDNAATHGGTDTSVVEVVRRDEEMVDITVSDHGRGIPVEERAQVFEWGRRGTSSTGEGIGLHLARRLMTEDGGSLRLADEQGVGSSFVISLPAARRSTENLVTEGDRHAWLRSG